MVMTEEYWLGYLAGMIDGEGSITLSKAGKHYQPRISIASSNVEHLKFLKDKFAEYFDCKIYSFKRPEGKGVRIMHQLYFSTSANIMALLKKLKLVLKSEQQKLLLEACKCIGRDANIWGSKGKPQWMLHKLEKIHGQMRILNRKGSKK